MFLWNGDPNKHIESHIDNLVKDTKNVKNVESVIASATEDKADKNMKRF